VDVLELLDFMHANMVFLFAHQQFAAVQEALRCAHQWERWAVDDSIQGTCTTMVARFVGVLEGLLSELQTFVVDQGVANEDLITEIGLATLACVGIFLDNIQYLAFDPLAPACELDEAPEEEQRLILLISNLRYFRDVLIVRSGTNPHPRFMALYQEQFGVDFPAEHIKSLCDWSDALEMMLVQRYVLLKSQPICSTIIRSFACSGFHWCKNHSHELTEAPLGVRPEVMEVLLEVVAVHAELTSAFGAVAKSETGPVRRGMALVVDAVVIAFMQGHRLPDEYSQDGAWQLLVDLSFAEWVLDVYTSAKSREALRDVVQAANIMAQTSGGKPRRDEVGKGVMRILEQTKRSTEFIWGGIRCPNT